MVTMTEYYVQLNQKMEENLFKSICSGEGN